MTDRRSAWLGGGCRPHMTLDGVFRILNNELEGYAAITRTPLAIRATAIETRDRGYVERQVDHWLGSYKRLGDIRITRLSHQVVITNPRGS